MLRSLVSGSIAAMFGMTLLSCTGGTSSNQPGGHGVPPEPKPPEMEGSGRPQDGTGDRAGEAGPSGFDAASALAYTLAGETQTVAMDRNTETSIPEAEPINQIASYVVGFHPMKDDPSHQMMAHHYCIQKTEHFIQCVLFDGNTKSANMNGIEYIISKEVYEMLPEDERQYWHPHNFEILSGQLAIPGVPEDQEHEIMKTLMNSYGKTWHTWMSHPFEGEGDALPLGEPKLGWSFNRDGEAKPGLVEQRDQLMSLDTSAMRQQREDLKDLAEPQQGEEALSGSFPSDAGGTSASEGVHRH